MQELPNPQNNLTWDTPNINDTLTEEHWVPLNEDGVWCFKAATGLWRIWHNFSPLEIEKGVVM